MMEQDEIQSQGNGDLEEHTANDHPNIEGEQDFWGALVYFWAELPQDEEQADTVTAARHSGIHSRNLGDNAKSNTQSR